MSRGIFSQLSAIRTKSSTSCLKRSIALCVIVGTGFLHAKPWDERDFARFATNLPKTLIDSIMAQGNFNLLFQESAFNEFQRVIAIANHFAMRDELENAQFFFRKAEAALSIAYSDLRSRYAWPRDYQQLRGLDLPWGENRNSFHEYLLALLQLQIERALAPHSTISDKPVLIHSDTVQNIENLSGVSLAQMDREFFRFIDFISGYQAKTGTNFSFSNRVRVFSEMTQKYNPSTNNYWDKKLFWYVMTENMQLGRNLETHMGLRLVVTEHKEKFDPVAWARLAIKVGDFEAAEALLSEILNRKNTSKQDWRDTITSHRLKISIQLARARAPESLLLSNKLVEFLTQLSQNPEFNREEIFQIKQVLTDMIFLRSKLQFLSAGNTCPSTPPFDPESFESMNKEWHLQYQLVAHTCKWQTADANYFETMSRAPEKLSPESQSLLIYEISRRKKATIEKLANPNLILSQYLAQILHVQAKARKNKFVDFQIWEHYFFLTQLIDPQFLWLNWGITHPLASPEIHSPLVRPQDWTEQQQNHSFIWAELQQRVAAQRIYGSIHNFHYENHLYNFDRSVGILDQSLPQYTPVASFRDIACSHDCLLQFSNGTWTARRFYQKKKRILQPLSEEPAEVTHTFSQVFSIGQLPDLKLNAKFIHLGGVFREDAPHLTDTSDACQTESCGTRPCPHCSTRLIALAPQKTSPANEIQDWIELFSEHTTLNTLRDSRNFYSENSTKNFIYVSGSPLLFDPEFLGEILNPIQHPRQIVVTIPKPHSAETLKLLWRQMLSLLASQPQVLVTLPEGFDPAVRRAFLFDFYLRSAQKNMRVDAAFAESASRANQRSNQNSNLTGVRIYEIY